VFALKEGVKHVTLRKPQLVEKTVITYQLHPDLMPAVAVGYLSHLGRHPYPNRNFLAEAFVEAFQIDCIQTSGVSDHLIGLATFFLISAGWVEL
jgi:hypothetical protein